MKKFIYWFKRYTYPDIPDAYTSTFDREFHGLCVFIIGSAVGSLICGALGLGFLGIVLGPLIAWMYGGIWVFVGGAMFGFSVAGWSWFIFRP